MVQTLKGLTQPLDFSSWLPPSFNFQCEQKLLCFRRSQWIKDTSQCRHLLGLKNRRSKSSKREEGFKLLISVVTGTQGSCSSQDSRQSHTNNVAALTWTGAGEQHQSIYLQVSHPYLPAYITEYQLTSCSSKHRGCTRPMPAGSRLLGTGSRESDAQRWSSSTHLASRVKNLKTNIVVSLLSKVASYNPAHQQSQGIFWEMPFHG